MDKKKVIAIGVSALLLGGLGGAILFPVHDVEIKEVTVEVPVPGPVEIQTVEVPGPVQYVDKIVNVEVPVDNGALDEVMSYVHDNVDEDLTVEYILFETDSKIEAEAYLRDNIVSLLDDNDFFDDGEVLQNYRKSEVSIKHIEDAVVLDKDYENKDLVLQYEVKVRAKEGSDDAEYFVFNVEVPFEDGKLVDEDIEVELI